MKIVPSGGTIRSAPPRPSEVVLHVSIATPNADYITPLARSGHPLGPLRVLCRRSTRGAGSTRFATVETQIEV
jgi:hypothetical protein